MDLAIFGAQSIALGAYQAIHKLYPVRNIKYFIVTKRNFNAENLKNIPVIELENLAKEMPQNEKNNIEILIATPENFMREIEESLEQNGFLCHVRLTSERFAMLQSFSYTYDKKFRALSALPVGYHNAELHGFMAKFYKDKKLETNYSNPDWITPIQVGASLCKERVAGILDCDGENISCKNVNYSELTALYWIWKNRIMGNWSDNENAYFGLCHYRRVQNLSNDDVLRLADNDVDVVLPFPMPYEPDIEEHHKRYLADCDWKALLTALEELQPEYAHAFPAILHQQYFYNYNIILARKSVLREYCSWLFPILERIEQLSSPKGWERQDRYIGYMGETLETLYFMYNRNNLNIVHTGCKFLT